MIAMLARLWQCRRAASAAEFALVLPLLLLLLFGTIDIGRFMWAVNEAEKATQAGARFAVVTTPVSPGLVDTDFASGTLPAGDLIPATALGALKCTSSACSCTGTCPVTDLSVDSAAFDAIVARMKAMDPSIAADNVEVTYRGSGFGFAGGPAGTMEMSPLVTVSLKNLDFTPITSFLLAQISMPAASTTLPAEDASGSYSN